MTTTNRNCLSFRCQVPPVQIKMGKCGPQPKVRGAWSDYGFDRTVYTTIKYRPYLRTSLPTPSDASGRRLQRGIIPRRDGQRPPANTDSCRAHSYGYAFTGRLVTNCFQAIVSEKAALDSSRTSVRTPPQRRASEYFDILLGNSLIHEKRDIAAFLGTLHTAQRSECGW
jgi:hypothetical protein